VSHGETYGSVRWHVALRFLSVESDRSPHTFSRSTPSLVGDELTGTTLSPMGVALTRNVPQSSQSMSFSTQSGVKRVAPLSPSSMYDIEDIDSGNTPGMETS
jgi:hypothetical protein